VFQPWYVELLGDVASQQLYGGTVVDPELTLILHAWGGMHGNGLDGELVRLVFGV
jgi:hypothetical protein